MIAVWMLYCIVIGCAFAAAGYALERGLRLAGRPMRWAWVVALVASYVVPIAAWLRPEAFASFPAPIPVLTEPSAGFPTPTTSTTSTILHQPSSRSFSLSALDAPLGWAWGLASVALLVTFAIAAIRLAAQRRAWRTSAVDGRLVLVSRDVGPAVVGVWQPRVVVPEWSLQLTPAERELMLAHEEEHLRAGDPWLLAGGVIALLLAPWNVALWGQWRRLRLAVEMDCDARVIARGGSAPVYGALLLQVGGRRSQLIAGAPAFGEPVSFLETRIRRMITALPRWRWAGAAAAIAIAAGAVVAACETPRPVSPAQVHVADSPPGAPQLTVDSATFESLKAQLRAQLADTSLATQLRVLLDSVSAQRMRPWVKENIQRLFPALLNQQSGPPMDVILVHNAGLQVSQGALVPRMGDKVVVADIQKIFKGFTPGNDGWGFVSPRALRGLVRDNVRVIWVHHDPASRDLSALERHPAMAQLPWLRQSIIKYYPQLLTERRGPPVHLWFIADPRKQVLRTVQRFGADSIRVGMPEIRAVFPDLAESKINSWTVTSPRGLRGFVRNNVYVVWIQLQEGATLP